MEQQHEKTFSPPTYDIKTVSWNLSISMPVRIEFRYRSRELYHFTGLGVVGISRGFLKIVYKKFWKTEFGPYTLNFRINIPHMDVALG